MPKYETSCTPLVAVLAIVAMLLFTVEDVRAERDARQTIYLDEESLAFVVKEMQLFVSGLQQAVTALAGGDMEAVAAALRPLGMQSMSTAPPTLMSTVPMEFRQLGMPIHMAFDKLADAAGQGASSGEILAGLGTAMNRCVACHAAYRIEPK